MGEDGGLPSVSAEDVYGRVREAAFALLLADRQPVALERLASLSGLSADRLEPLLDTLARAGWIDRDAEGRVSGSAGLSLTTGPHRLVLDGTAFHTWCAYDAIGIAAALAADATIETACGVCGRHIALDPRAGRLPVGRAERLWLAAGGDDLRGDFCDPTVLLCSAQHAEAWAATHPGRAVDLKEAARLGAAAWAGCAAATGQLSARLS
jgi:alkylmercury lyase